MKIAGIIAEYNPFHAGHISHIEQTRKNGATHVVVIMSGSTVQRGEFSILRKEARTKMALKNGADLVICLPTPWSCARANDFCRAAVHIAEALGCVDMLSFGSECGDMDLLKSAVDGLRDGGVLDAMKRQIGEGVSFAVARQNALAQVNFEAAQCLRRPNDTLNVEYIAALEAIGSEIEPVAIPRIEGERYTSASELRIIIQKTKLTSYCNDLTGQILLEEISGGFLVNNRALELAILARLRSMAARDFAQLPDISEGMEHLLHRAVRQGCSLEEIISVAVGKRYPASRLRRILFYALLCVTSEWFDELPHYIQLLGCNDAGYEVLQRVKKSAALPILHRHADIKKLDSQGLRLYNAECRATDMQALAMQRVQPCGLEEKRKIVVS